MKRAASISIQAMTAVLCLCPAAHAINIKVLPPKGFLDWAAICAGLFFFGWGIREVVAWRRRAKKVRRTSRGPHRDTP